MAHHVESRIFLSITPRSSPSRALITRLVSGSRASSSICPADTRRHNLCMRSLQLFHARPISSSTKPISRSPDSNCISQAPRKHHCRTLSSNRRLQNPKQDAKSPNGCDDGSSKKAGSPPKPRLIESTRALRNQVRERLSNLTPHENIYTIPNILTFSRLLATPVIGYLVLHDNHAWAVGLFAYAGITDFIDGWIARRWKLQTVVGSVIDPMADKFLMTVLVGCLAVKGAIPLWLAAVIFGRDMSLGFSAIYYRYASLPAPKTFMRYWDFSIPSAEVHPTTVSKWNTFLQLGLIGSTVVTPLLTSAAVLSANDIQTILQSMQYVVAVTTLWSGASYLFLKDAVVILGTDEALKRKQGLRGRLILGVSFAAFLALALELARHEAGEEKTSTPADKRGDSEVGSNA